MKRILDLFAGIGGFSLGFERTGKFETIGFVENNLHRNKILRKHWSDVHIHENIETRQFREGEADIITGGFPCQDVSHANSAWGLRSGLAGLRSGLWRELLRAIRVVRPENAVVENVAALLNRGMGTVLGDLAEIGYDTEWHCIPASAIGAPHERDRVWIVAHTGSERSPRLVSSADFGEVGQGWACSQADLQSIVDAPFERGDRWPQPLIRGTDDGVFGRTHRLEGVGNSVHPQIAEIIAKAIP